MYRKQKKIVLGSLVLLSFFSSIYLNFELKAVENSIVSVDAKSLPDINLLKSLIRMVLEPLKLG